MKLRHSSMAIAMFFVAGSASAADLVTETPAVSPIFTWTGFYVGAQGGYGWGDGDFAFGGGSDSRDFNGGIVGGFVGYNWQFDNIVLGVEGDASYNWNEETIGGGDVKFDTAGSVRARVGYAFDRALIYGAGGWTATRAHVDAGIGDDSDTLSGWTVGAGVDYAFTNNVFGRVEYRYNDFGSGDLLGVDTDFTQNVVKIGVGFKF